MIVIRRQNKSGKSSAESEGSPDEVLIFGQMRYLSIVIQQLELELKVGGSGRKKPGVLTDNLQRQRFELILLISFLYHLIHSRSLSNSAEGKEKKPTANIRKERARKLKGSENKSVYHFCPQCM